MTKNTTKNEISEIKTVLNRQKYINILFVGLFFLISRVIIFDVPHYSYETTTEIITFEVEPNECTFTHYFSDSLYNDNTWVEKIICDDDVLVEKQRHLNDDVYYSIRNHNNIPKKCMMEIHTKIRVIK